MLQAWENCTFQHFPIAKKQYWSVHNLPVRIKSWKHLRFSEFLHWEILEHDSWWSINISHYPKLNKVFGKREKEKERGGEKGKERIGEVQYKSECRRVLEKTIDWSYQSENIYTTSWASMIHYIARPSWQSRENIKINHWHLIPAYFQHLKASFTSLAEIVLAN